MSDIQRNSEQENSINSDSNENGGNDQMTKLFGLIVTSLENNREDDLVSSGLKVSKKSARQTLDNKINDPQMQNVILGPMNDLEEIEIWTRLQAVCAEEEQRMNDMNGCDDIQDGKALEIDDSVFQGLRAEAYQTLDKIRKNGSAMGKLLEDEEAFGTYITPEKQKPTRNSTAASNGQQRPSSDSQQPFDPLVWGPTPTRGLEILLSPIDTTLFPEFKDNSGKNGPPDVSLFEEVSVGEEEDYSDDDDSSHDIENTFMNKNNDGTIGVGSIRKVGEGRSKHFEFSLHSPKRADKFSYNSALYMSSKDTDYDTSSPSVVEQNILLENSDSSSNSDSENKFAALLRESMVQASANSEKSIVSLVPGSIDMDETRRRTVDAITSGQVGKLGKLTFHIVTSNDLVNDY